MNTRGIIFYSNAHETHPHKVLTHYRVSHGIAASYADYQAGMDAYHAGDYATAFEEFQPLAEQGNVTALYMLGDMYAKVQGVPQDYAECCAWSNIAAASGVEEAKKAGDICASKLSPEALAKAQSKVRKIIETTTTLTHSDTTNAFQNPSAHVERQAHKALQYHRHRKLHASLPNTYNIPF